MSDRARAFFERELASSSDDVVMSIDEVRRDDLAVPGFVTFEANQGDARAAGWANDEGVVVLSRQLDFRPIADALGVLRGDGVPADLARRVAWAIGPSWAPIDARPSDLGDAAPAIEPTRRVVRDDGSSFVVFYLRDLDPNEPTIVKFVIDGREPPDTVAETWEVWPEDER